MMMMMDCGSQFTESTLSSDTMSGSVGSVQPSIRTVRLVRPNTGTLPPPNITARHGPSLGFSLRGGREHGTGFYVSVIEPGSEAHRQGLKIGDQIIRINGFTIEDAVHKEALQLISNYTHLTLKVRSVGMIPVKDKQCDLLTWHIISDGTSSTRSSPPLTEKIHDVRINIAIAPRTKLGCGICKGPEWKPGIFVQFTKEGGIAREAGLRPGDQILSCNNVDFNDIPFNEAVNIMKSARQLDLLVRKSAGSELFPGESSGYNSSASSVTGDQSPSWSDQKRLSIVKEESLELEDRLCHLDRFKGSKWDEIEWEDIDNDKRYQFKPTIINLSENGTTITNGDPEECPNLDANCDTLTKTKCRKIGVAPETKTVVVQVHRNNQVNAKSDSSSGSDCSSINRNSDSSSSLSSAISQELLRRCQRKQTEVKPTIDEQLQKQKILKGVDAEKQEQHTKLMNEFRKVHRKMFKTDDECVEMEKEACPSSERRACSKTIENRSAPSSKETPQEKSSTRYTDLDSSPPPPPPPPPPADFDLNAPHFDEEPKTKTKIAPPVPAKYSTLSFAKELHPPQPPPCPTPDYDTVSVNSNYTRNVSSSQDDAIDLDAVDSTKINNLYTPRPKYSNTYSKLPLTGQLSNSSITSTTSLSSRRQRPVSVTIGEYPSGSLRKQPGRLDFLNNTNAEVEKLSNGSISTQFASELAHTLSRSNLRKRTESMENLLNNPQIQSQSNGSVTISLNTGKKLDSLKAADGKSNRVTINICSTEKKPEVPNGILKNGNGNGNHNFYNSNHKTLVQQKSITFGEM
ncbi:hypothetical protein FQA39_LY18039 [Lamprigera yunnana]|nr:hypothetical protein FQA39_LY18039 [Lamprigera yunnana]